ncbi:hypothetical protein P43SY_002091 [Pythium insidiosum]|uniref:Mif2/CENP-C cupin domain-containing protein n=1 Tax=Pythium insidiosum TaxID=114742 RepID=A0AAD5LSK9_PYTIN|nr:hypothetical protein P43SY_002091 [Pythium insidiosum]KAJ0411068.1 hypothetical protein ATCC90586_008043 [Pythium insidiosum]
MDTDDLATLMPRTKAVAERTDVNVANLKDYMASAQHENASLSLSQRTSVMVRSDVRKDDQGFEDIDEFWADDDVAEEKDAETEGDEWAAKEAESVGDAIQVFFVMGGQPQALEVAFGPVQDDYFDPKTATRFLLNPSDEFYVPAQNAYYLKNHSDTTTCELHFMILKPDAARQVASSALKEKVEPGTNIKEDAEQRITKRKRPKASRRSSEEAVDV